jgi:hypothetical protein
MALLILRPQSDHFLAFPHLVLVMCLIREPKDTNADLHTAQLNPIRCISMCCVSARALRNSFLQIPQLLLSM